MFTWFGWFMVSQQPENWENSNGPDLVQVFLKKWWVQYNIM
jgi:hypothetical protein